MRTGTAAPAQRAASQGRALTCHACGAAESSGGPGIRRAQRRLPPEARGRWSGSPTIRVATANRCDGSTGSPSVLLPAIREETQTWCLFGYSLGRSLCLAAVAHHGDKQVSDAGGANLAKRGQLLTINTLEQQDAPPHALALLHRFERPCRGDV